jgi:hypothetical protein
MVFIDKKRGICMASKNCRLYDENLVHNIMISTGLSILDYMKDNKNIDGEELCEFIEINAKEIIEDTIAQLSSNDDIPESEPEIESGNSSDDGWPFINPERDE